MLSALAFGFLGLAAAAGVVSPTDRRAPDAALIKNAIAQMERCIPKEPPFEPFGVPREWFRLPVPQDCPAPRPQVSSVWRRQDLAQRLRSPGGPPYCTMRVIVRENDYDRGPGYRPPGEPVNSSFEWDRMAIASTCLPDPDTVTYWGR
jgi:hypothetical protein